MSLRLMICAATAAVGVFGSIAAANADTWSVSEIRDPTNAELTQAATVTNYQGYSISIFRNKDGKVRWVLSLPQGSLDSIKTAGRVAAFRVDNKNASDIEVSAGSDLEQPVILGRSIRDLLWHGQGASPTRGSLRDMLDGHSLAVRFYFDNGGSVDTAFDLTRAGNSIGPALKIETNADPNVMAREQDRDAAVLMSATVCQSSSKMSACLGAMTECMGSDPNQLTGDQMRSCMAEHGYPFQ